VENCLIIINRPVHIMYFYGLWDKQIIPHCRSIDFFVNHFFFSYLERFKSMFSFPNGKIYSFKEPAPSFYANSRFIRYKNLILNFITYRRIFHQIQSMDLSSYDYVLTFADDMLHFQYLIFNYKKSRPNGAVFLADEGVGLYDRGSIDRESFLRRIIKKIIFRYYQPVPMGCNPLVDTVFARLPEEISCFNQKKVKKADYYIRNLEDVEKLIKVFNINTAGRITNLLSMNSKKILFLGFPFEAIGIHYSEIIKLLCRVKEVEKTDIIIKPHPKESKEVIALYKKYFDVFPRDFPAELLFSKVHFKFVFSYCSSALIESKLYGQKTYYFNFFRSSYTNKELLGFFGRLDISEYYFCD